MARALALIGELTVNSSANATATDYTVTASAGQTVSYTLDRTVGGITVDDNGIISVDSTAVLQESTAFTVTATGSNGYTGSIASTIINIEIVAATRPQYERKNGIAGGTTTVLGHTAGVPVAPPTTSDERTFYPLADARTGNTYTLTRDVGDGDDAAVIEPVLDPDTGALTLSANTTPGAYTISTGTGAGTVSTKVYVTTTPTNWEGIASALEVGITNFGNTADYNYIIPNNINITSLNSLFSSSVSLDRERSRNARPYLTDFNGDIGGWDVSNVSNMINMFAFASAFNQDIGDWDVSNVIYMVSVFGSANAFNKDISAWDVSKAITMWSMFENASAFNQDISAWDVSKVTTMETMFRNASAFSQNLEAWGEHLPLDGAEKATISKTDMFTGSEVSGDLIPSWY